AWVRPDRSTFLGRYWRNRPLVFSLLPRCHGDRGSQKYTGTPLSIVNALCSESSEPWSQVSERRSSCGSAWIRSASTRATFGAVLSASAASITNRVWRSTSVATCDRFADPSTDLLPNDRALPGPRPRLGAQRSSPCR